MRTKLLLSFILLILFVNSCTIEKRLYNKGFHVQFNHIKQQKSTNKDRDLSKHEEQIKLEQDSVAFQPTNITLDHQDDGIQKKLVMITKNWSQISKTIRTLQQ